MRFGKRALVIGSGSVGIMTAIAIESTGSEPVLCDIDNNKINIAKSLKYMAFKNDEINDEYDYVFECSGYGSEFALKHTSRGGILVLIGMGNENIDALVAITKGITIKGIFRYANIYGISLELIKKNRKKLKIFQSNIIPMNDLPAFLRYKKYNKFFKTIVEL